MAESYGAKVIRFEEAAQNITEGKGYVIYSKYFGRYISYLLEYPPGFSFLLILISYVGISSHLSIQLFQILLATITCYILYKITCCIASARAGIIAVVIVACSPILARYDVAIEPGVPAMLLMSASLYLLLCNQKNCAIRSSMAGLLIGCAALLLQDYAGLAIFMLVAFLLARGGRFVIRYGSLFFISYLLAVSPNIAMNYHVLQRIMIMPSFIGAVMMKGLGQFGGTGDLYMPMTHRELLEYEGVLEKGKSYPECAGEEILLYYPNPFEREKVRRAEVIRFVKKHPLFVLKCIVNRIPILISGNITGITPDQLDESAGQIEGKASQKPVDQIVPYLYRRTASFFRYFKWIEWLLFILALIGVMLSAHNWRKTIFIMAVPCYFFACHLLLYIEPRMMTPALPFIYIFTGICLDAISRRVRHARIAST